jgi:hypothetical protein
MKNKRIFIIRDGCPYMMIIAGAFRNKYGHSNVIAAGKTLPPYTLVDINNKQEREQLICQCSITILYFLQNNFNGERVSLKWDVKIHCLFPVLDVAVKYKLVKVFWPGNMVVFENPLSSYKCIQDNHGQPVTALKTAKCVGEFCCNYYFYEFGIDVLTFRFQAIINHSVGKDADQVNYRVAACGHALKKRPFTRSLVEHLCRPAMFMADVVRAVLKLMATRMDQILAWAAYELARTYYALCDLAARISKPLPFEVCLRTDRSHHMSVCIHLSSTTIQHAMIRDECSHITYKGRLKKKSWLTNEFN